MMKHKTIFRLFSFSLIIFLILVINDCSSPVDKGIDYSFEMYYLSDEDISYSEAVKFDPDSLDIETSPFISDSDIKCMTVIYLNDNPNRSYSYILKDSVNILFSEKVRPFISILNGQRFFIAEYWPAFMSIVPKSIFMYRMLATELHLHAADDDGKSKLKKSKLIDTFRKLGIEIVDRNIGDKL